MTISDSSGSPGSATCGNGHELKGDSAFCEECGLPRSAAPSETPVAAPITTPAAAPSLCANGHAMKPGNFYCPTCGAPAHGTAPTPTPAPAYQQPVYQQPVYQQPVYQQPTAPPSYYVPNTPYQQNVPYQYVAVNQGQSTNGLAIASMVLGILWIYWVGSVLAVIFGFIALKQIRERNEGGRGMAIAGLVLGFIGFAVAVLVIILVAVAANSNNFNDGNTLLPNLGHLL